MELPRRAKSDVYTPAGRYRELQAQVGEQLDGDVIPTLFIYAFDYRTRLGPYLFADKLMIPGAATAVGAALYGAGFRDTRVVLQQWNRNIRPSYAAINGRRPQMLFVSSMQIHSDSAYRLIDDAWSLRDERPLILAGGPKAIYEPWDFFGLGPDYRRSVDVVVTGEEFVILELIRLILEYKKAGESMRSAFDRVRLAGLLDQVPGLVYSPAEGGRAPDYLVNTGVQRLVEDLDELPLPHMAASLFERPHSRKELSPQALRPRDLGRYARAVALVTTHGCKFHCPYCPIPAYNQFTFRRKSPDRFITEISDYVERTRIRNFFGTDDNFFNSRDTVSETFSALSTATIMGKRMRDAIWLGTEATEYDVYKNLDLLPLCRDGGLGAIWFGIEDLTATLVKKGQSASKTTELFAALTQVGIAPMPMLIHHDGQPVRSQDGIYGILDQVDFVSRAGALSVQVSSLMPMVGTKGYEKPFNDGLVMEEVAGFPVADHLYDGTHCIATVDTKPWRKEVVILLAYARFYNPVNLIRALVTFDKMWNYRVVRQILGQLGLAITLCAKLRWIIRLIRGPITKHRAQPSPKFVMHAARAVDPALSRYRLDSLVPDRDAAPQNRAAVSGNV